MYNYKEYYQETGTNTAENNSRRSTYREQSEDYRTQYTYGNTVRRYETAPDYDYDDDCSEIQRKIRDNRKKERAREERARHSRLKRLEKAKGLNLIACVVMTGFVLIILSICIKYIRLKADITSMSEKVVQKQSEYNTLKAKNDSELKEVEASINLQDIYKIATVELGMVFANNNQVVTYEGSESAYVRQYKDLPEEPEANVLDDFVNKTME